jgi:chorismate--pyruvate lyase
MPAHWLSKPAVGGELHRWLTSEGSLSQRIVDCCPQFRVVRLMQARRRANPDESLLAGVPVGRCAIVREVLLLCGSTPLVFAHSIVAAEHLRGAWHSLRGLGTRPLASALFADPRVSRGPLRYRKIGLRHPLYVRAAEVVTALPSELWARRSVFHRHHAPLLVTEVFLPGILALNLDSAVEKCC